MGHYFVLSEVTDLGRLYHLFFLKNAGNDGVVGYRVPDYAQHRVLGKKKPLPFLRGFCWILAVAYLCAMPAAILFSRSSLAFSILEKTRKMSVAEMIPSSLLSLSTTGNAPTLLFAITAAASET